MSNDNQELIVVKQLPLIEEHLKELSVKIDEKVKSAKSLICTEETVKEVKQVRADLNKEFKELETQRKLVKEQVLTPYMQFEEIYKQYVSDKYRNADIELKSKVDSIENELKVKKEQEIKDYFEEYKTANNIDFITYEQARINVTLSASIKSLKEQAKQFIDKIVDDLKLIETQEHKTEILVEYKQLLNVSQAITSVTNRFKAIEEENRKHEELKNKLYQQMSEEANRAIARDTVLQAPVEEKQEEMLTVNFTVKGTKTKLRELKQFLESGGYDYE
jgi:hypothetical protein